MWTVVFCARRGNCSLVHTNTCKRASPLENTHTRWPIQTRHSVMCIVEQIYYQAPNCPLCSTIQEAAAMCAIIYEVSFYRNETSIHGEYKHMFACHYHEYSKSASRIINQVFKQVCHLLLLLHSIHVRQVNIIYWICQSRFGGMLLLFLLPNCTIATCLLCASSCISSSSLQGGTATWMFKIDGKGWKAFIIWVVCLQERARSIISRIFWICPTFIPCCCQSRHWVLSILVLLYHGMEQSRITIFINAAK